MLSFCLGFVEFKVATFICLYGIKIFFCFAELYLAGGETSNNSNSDRDSEIMGPLPTTGSAVAPASWAALQPQNGQYGPGQSVLKAMNGDYPPQSLIDGMDGLNFII